MQRGSNIFPNKHITVDNHIPCKSCVTFIHTYFDNNVTCQPSQSFNVSGDQTPDGKKGRKGDEVKTEFFFFNDNRIIFL